MKKALTIDDYGIETLLEVARDAASESWQIKRHPKQDALTVYSRTGYVIHPDLGFINDEADAAFIAMFDPAMVISILERLAHGWNQAIDKAQEELVRRDQFSERTLRILDELRIPEPHDAGPVDAG